MVAALFFGAFPAAKACLELLRHHRSVSCEVDAGYFAASTEALVTMFVRQVLNQMSDISDSNEMLDACGIMVLVLDRL